MAIISISRDPFARQETVRETLYTTVGCDWCGNRRQDRNGKFLSLFRYGTQRDSLYGRVNWHKGNFCSKSCHDSYHS